MAYLSYDYLKIVEEFEKWLEDTERKEILNKFLSIKKKYEIVVGVGKDKGNIGIGKDINSF